MNQLIQIIKMVVLFLIQAMTGRFYATIGSLGTNTCTGLNVL